MEALARYPGCQGDNIVRPDARTNHEYVFFARWDSQENALAWEKSPERCSEPEYEHVDVMIIACLFD